MKRLLFLTHRWLGVALSLFMLLWFFSGLAMLYAGPMTVSREQGLAAGEPLRPQAGWLSVGAAWAKGGPPDRAERAIAGAQLVRQGGEPIWLVQDQHGGRYALSALDGAARPADPARALAIARQWREGGHAPSLLASSERDAATAMMSYDPYRPFHRIALNDAAGTELYVSARSGEVVRAGTRWDRALFWCGSYLHFLRPLDAIGLGAIRKDVLTWGALAACVTVLLGIWLGLQRWRPGWFGTRRYAEGRSNPYRAFWQKWHLWLGLSGGVLALTWTFSGFLSNNPWQLFQAGHMMQGHHAHHEMARYQGGGLPQQALAMPMAEVQTALAGGSGADIVELSWQHLGARSVLLAYDRSGQNHTFVAGPAGRLAPQSTAFDQSALLAAAARLRPGVRIRAFRWQDSYDSYYYRQQRHPVSERPLPVLRVELNDAAATWLYLDPATGALVSRQGRSARVFRWLFSGLHTWDMGWLAKRPLWDGWMVSGCLIGLALAVSSLIIGWRRLRRTIGGIAAAPQASAALASMSKPGSR